MLSQCNVSEIEEAISNRPNEIPTTDYIKIRGMLNFMTGNYTN